MATKLQSRLVTFSVLMAVVASHKTPSVVWAQTEHRPTFEADVNTLPWHRGVPEQRKEEARALLAEAATLTEELRFLDAIAKYQQALSHWDHPEIRFELSRAVFQAGRPLDAWNHLQRAWQWGPDALIGRDGERAREFGQTLLRDHLAIIEVRCDQPDVVVALDGKVLFRGPGVDDHVVDPGEHVLSAKRAGYFSLVKSVSLSAGQRGVIVLELSPDRLVQRQRWPSWKPWAVAGAGVAVGLMGVGLLAQARHNFGRAGDTFRDHCNPGCLPSLPPPVFPRAMGARFRHGWLDLRQRSAHRRSGLGPGQPPAFAPHRGPQPGAPQTRAHGIARSGRHIAVARFLTGNSR
ncbi:MAG: hypothetical protein MJE77_11175 [Proteobacteria bacterium]|nr:hypothetical protein [Pseudomonadota bacterium]